MLEGNQNKNLEGNQNINCQFKQQPLKGRFSKLSGRGENVIWGDLVFYGRT